MTGDTAVSQNMSTCTGWTHDMSTASFGLQGPLERMACDAMWEKPSRRLLCFMLSSRHINILWSAIIFIFFASELQYPGVWFGGTISFNICLLLKATSCRYPYFRKPPYHNFHFWLSLIPPFNPILSQYIPSHGRKSGTTTSSKLRICWKLAGNRLEHHLLVMTIADNWNQIEMFPSVLVQ